MNKNQWIYDSIMSEEVNMNDENKDEAGVNEEEHRVRLVAYEIGFVAVIMRSDTNTGMRGRTSFVLIGCERSGQYRSRKKDFVRRDTGSRKWGCPFKLRGKPVVGGQGWMVKLICGSHNHELAKSLVGDPYIGQLTKNEKIIIVDMTSTDVYNSYESDDPYAL
ncbi:hypothetical protein GmHk_01G000794 [Glycine max]|nr:hypothetical protein GmHk_01G000794 [Glycine max]